MLMPAGSNKRGTRVPKICKLYRIIYYSLSALHVSSDISVHHPEYLNCITASGIKHVYCCQLAATNEVRVYQQDETVQDNLLFVVCSTCFQRYFRSSSGVSKLYYSFWYYTRTSLPAASDIRV
jgi:hypothetical protein